MMNLGVAAVVLWAAAIVTISGLAVVRSRRRGRGCPSPLLYAEPMHVLVVRPCSGLEPSLARTLSSANTLRDVREAVSLRVVHAVASTDDPAHPFAVAAAAELRRQGLDATVVITGATGANQKASQLARLMAAERRWDVLVGADSDVELDRRTVAALLSPFADPGVGATWAPPVEVAPPRGWGDRASQAVLAGSLHSFPVLAGIDPGGMVGKLFAVRRCALEAADGLSSLVSVLGEDVELGRRLRRRGWQVVAIAATAASLASQRTFAEVVDRFARWIQVVRSQRRPLLLSYPFLFSATPPVVLLGSVLAGAGAGASAASALGAALGATLARAAVAWEARRAAGLGRSLRALAADIVLADCTLALAFLRAVGTRRLRWRGRELALARDGRIEEMG